MAQGLIIGFNVVTVGSHPAARIGVKEVSATEAIFSFRAKGLQAGRRQNQKKIPTYVGKCKLHRKFAYWLSIEGGHLETIAATGAFMIEPLSEFAIGAVPVGYEFTCTGSDEYARNGRVCHVNHCLISYCFCFLYTHPPTPKASKPSNHRSNHTKYQIH